MSSVLGVSLPAGWSVAPLKYVTSLVDRGLAPDYVDDGSVRVIGQSANQVSGLNWARTRFHNHIGDPRLLRGFLTPGDILVNSTGTGTLGRVGYFHGGLGDGPCIADGHITIVRTLPTVLDARYAYYWLSSRLFQGHVFASLVAGATNQIELSRGGLRESCVPIPPYDEQLRIARLLDRETRLIDRLDVGRQMQLAMLNERLQSAMDFLFCSCSSVTSIRLKDLLAVRPRYGVLVPEFVDDGVPFVRVNDLIDLDARIDELSKISVALSRQYLRTVVRSGDLLLSVVGTLGRAAIAPEGLRGANIARAVASLRVRAGVDARLVLAWIRSSEFERQALLATGSDTAQPTLGMEDLANFQIHWPASRSDQEVMSDHLCEIQRSMSGLQRLLERQRVCLVERRQELITAAVTGQFDVSTVGGGGG